MNGWIYVVVVVFYQFVDEIMIKTFVINFFPEKKAWVL